MRDRQLPGGQRLVASYLTDRYLDRAQTARFWRTIPQVIRGLSEIEYQSMREFAIRSLDAEKKAIDAAKLGAPTPKKKGPKPGDEIVGDDGF